MWRYFVGGGAALLLALAGMFLFRGSASPEAQPALPRVPAAPAAASDDPLPEAPSADARTREQKRFDRIDKDRNQTITPQEFFALRHKLFAKLDTDHDGKLSFDDGRCAASSASPTPTRTDRGRCPRRIRGDGGQAQGIGASSVRLPRPGAGARRQGRRGRRQLGSFSVRLNHNGKWGDSARLKTILERDDFDLTRQAPPLQGRSVKLMSSRARQHTHKQDSQGERCVIQFPGRETGDGAF